MRSKQHRNDIDPRYLLTVAKLFILFSSYKVARFSVTKVNFVMNLVQKTANTVTYIAGNVLEPATQAFMETNANSTIEVSFIFTLKEKNITNGTVHLLNKSGKRHCLIS